MGVARRIETPAQAIKRLEREIESLKGLAVATRGALQGRMPQGVLGYIQRNSSITVSPGFNDVGAVSITVDVAANRMVKVTGFVPSITPNAATDRGVLLITDADDNVLQHQIVSFNSTNADQGVSVIGVFTPSEGSHTYKLRYQSLSTGNVTLRANSPNYFIFLIAEDIGQAL